MTILFILFIISLLIFPWDRRNHPKNLPMIHTQGDYNSHLAFLEMHGCISEEERLAMSGGRKTHLVKETYTMKELMDIIEKKPDDPTTKHKAEIGADE